MKFNSGWANLNNHKGHKKLYPKTSEAALSWIIGSADNLVIQRTKRSDAKICDVTLKAVKVGKPQSIVYRKILPSTCICHLNYFHSTRRRTIYDELSKKSKHRLMWIFNGLDIQQRARRRVKNRLWHLNNIQKEKEYHRRINQELKIQVLTYYSGGTPRCACCSETFLAFLTIAHPPNFGISGTKHRKQIREQHHKGSFYYYLRDANFPPGFRVLCMNCNIAERDCGECNQTNHQRKRTGSRLVTIFN